jgi:hemolysin activation/secretion protein
VPSYLRFTCRLLQKAAIFAALVAGGALSGAAVASDVPECEQACFVLTGVQLQGVSAFPASELAYTYEDYLTRPVAVEDLVKVAASITDHYRAEGYFLTRAAVAPPVGATRPHDDCRA